MSSWETQSNRSTVETLLAMGFIPTWLEELLDEGDKLQENVRFLQKSVEVLGAVRGDWLEKYNESLVLVEQLQQANKDLAQLVLHITEKHDAIQAVFTEDYLLLLNSPFYRWKDDITSILKILGMEVLDR